MVTLNLHLEGSDVEEVPYIFWEHEYMPKPTTPKFLKWQSIIPYFILVDFKDLLILASMQSITTILQSFFILI